MNVNHPLTVFSFRSSKLGALFREESFSAAIRPGSSSESEAKLSAVESRFKSCLAIAFSSGTSAVAIVVAAVTTDRGSVPWDTSTMSPSGRCSSMHTDVANKGGEPTTSSIAITAASVDIVLILVEAITVDTLPHATHYFGGAEELTMICWPKTGNIIILIAL